MDYSEFERIRDRVKPLVRKYAPRLRRLGYDYEDVEQEAIIAALECQKSAYLRKALIRRIIDILRRHHTYRLFDGVPYIIDPHYEQQEKERDAREWIEHYLTRSGMSSRDRTIVRRYAQGATLIAAGAEFGVSEATACLIVSRFKTLCRHKNG